MRDDFAIHYDEIHLLARRGVDQLPQLEMYTDPNVPPLPPHISSAAHRLGDVMWADINFERDPYDRAKAYSQAKTANMLFAVELDRRLSSHDVRVFGVHPGVINTNLHRHLTKVILAELRAAAAAGGARMAPQMRKTIPQGAATSVWAATAPELDGKGGLYLRDCGIAPPATPEVTGVKPYALDPAAAARLWAISERMNWLASGMGFLLVRAAARDRAQGLRRAGSRMRG